MGQALGAVGGMMGMHPGGGGGVPTVGDVSGNVANANKTFGKATSYGDQTMAAAQSLNNNANKTLSATIGQELPALSNVNNYANSNYSQYQNTFQPLQAQQAQQAKDYTSGENIDMLRGRAVADSNSALQAGRQNAAMALAAEGVDPASIHGGALDRQASVMGAAQNAGAANNSYLSTMNTGRQLVANANQLGMEVGNQGNAGAQIGSGIATNLVNSQTGSNSGAVNNLKAADTYLNTATDANTSGANITHQANQDALAQAQAQSAAQGGAAGALGGALGGLSSAFGGSAGGAGSAGGILGTAAKLAPLAAMFMEKGGPVTSKGALPFSPVPGSTDTKPLMATPGEFVIPKDVVEHKGNEFFHKLIDSTRLKMNERRAIPQPVFAHQSNH